MLKLLKTLNTLVLSMFSTLPEKINEFDITTINYSNLLDVGIRKCIRTAPMRIRPPMTKNGIQKPALKCSWPN